ncbi:2-C-methyl-D-erythritol 4-phosphate cytidylyltransferase [Plectonema cf. radiosum LEGE 06105]|uniref:2-C-methyl-D-erythritol 4-phosphate cytidylyltransferase n=1 Tax=Plectonema cf. radiosum LEGE 06105 TaxID=945769 RepID=A0A8J7F7I0_9CYAN|nr:2-C-methyl-D-erythritol 4-phosphate cytidylyltransferase [Plectonema radiosum]MBE9216107.1 2-C-methyl-D-erythritol 4-phosphate cytidylyltransferase [Plectonema cf. radiosum LEGE 06105]
MYLLIPAAGSGRRMNSNRNKLLLNLLGQSIISWTIQAATTANCISWIGIISQPDDWQDFEEIIEQLKLNKPVKLILGGSTRQESVYNGLRALPASASQVLIHDGARCLATPNLFDSCAETLLHTDGLIAAVPVKDTIKIVNDNNIVQSTPDRRQLWAAQTPQGFDVKLLTQCHTQAVSKAWQVTDDAALFEKCGLEVSIVQGEETNLKITTPQDLAIAEFILKSRNG